MIHVVRWGTIAYYGSLAEAEDFRACKARWEGAVAYKRVASLPEDRKMIQAALLRIHTDVQTGVVVDEREQAALQSPEVQA